MSWEVRCPSFQLPALATEELSGRGNWVAHDFSAMQKNGTLWP